MNVNVVKKEAVKYPKLVIYKNNKSIVLLTEESVGIVLSVGKSTNKLGQHETCWVEVGREDFTGILELSN